ncbi:YbhB/YbcL family Raf kinase inhibitor-like protein [Pantoea sp. S-LA4]|uniref:YbhB/YbcL family Raf kinase inhibitor-like protein n=1 Tax=Pantoea TaxID=53335 RepID=UPI001F264847|nr:MULTISPECIES: YbhB/YbcL family Raf kinase inhibitor-like protein [Pantoea]UIL54755.1 YbhB/YbcL family Raf kinase inhibitor-like protein [Pantoea agglomerans]
MKKLLCAMMLATLPVTTLAASVFTLQSKDFNDNALLDKKFAGANKSNPSCTGENISPELNWSAVPAGTRSLALLMTDPVGAKGLGVTHMVAYNIAPDRNAFAQGELTQGKGYTGGKNTPGTQHYYGPCPPAGSGLHHYNFVLIATDLPAGQLKAGLTHQELLSQLKGHAIGAASTVGRFSNE